MPRTRSAASAAGAAAASVVAVTAAARQLAAEWREKHRGLFRKADGGLPVPPKKAPPSAKKHAPAPKTTTPPPAPATTIAPAAAAETTPAPAPATTPTTSPAPALWAPEEAVLRAAMPAMEEYDRSERFGHSFIHGFRPF